MEIKQAELVWDTAFNVTKPSVFPDLFDHTAHVHILHDPRQPPLTWD
jgi:hypothetical protein